jgi:hypothetical protein
MDKKFAKEKANDITSTGKAVGFPANLKVYTGGKAPGVDKWLVYAREFSDGVDSPTEWEYLETAEQVENFIKVLG